MAEIADRLFSSERVEIDGNTYQSCRFEGCRMVYSGGGFPTFNSCSFDNCNWHSTVAEGKGLELLNSLPGGVTLTENSPGTKTPPKEQS
jgi:hypothetical protein